MKHLTKGLALALAMLCFVVSDSFAQAGSTGRPTQNWVTSPVCADFNGVDSSLVERALYVQGQNDDLPVVVKYHNSNNEIVDVTGATITRGYCEEEVEGVTSKIDIFEVEMCDYEEVLDTFMPFIRVFLIETDLLNGNTISTTLAADINYDGSTHTVQGVAGIGLCAKVEDPEAVIDYEYSTECMVDVQGNGSEIEFIRILNHHDSTTADITLSYLAYTITGTAQRCSEKEASKMIELCDVTKQPVDLDYAATVSAYGVSFALTSNVSGALPTRNTTIDCGQGQRVTGKFIAQCDCDYSESPDGQYQIAMAIDFAFGGTDVVNIGTVTIDDGQLTYSGAATVAYDQSDVITTATAFYRMLNADGTTTDVDINNQAYTVVGEASKACDNRDRFNQVFEPSTRPDLDIVGSDECWEKTISSDNTVSVQVNLYNNATLGTIDNSTVIGLEINSAGDATVNMIPVLFRQGETKADRKEAVKAIQDALIGAGISFASVTSKDSTINIVGLPSSVTSLRLYTQLNTAPTADEFIDFNMGTYSGDTTLYHTIYRYTNDGREALTIDHFGHETYMPTDAKRVNCNYVEQAEEVCAVQHIGTVERISGGVFTFAAGTFHHIDIAPETNGVLVSMNGGAFVEYPLWYANRVGSSESCELFQTEVTIDLSAVGTSALITMVK